MRDGIVMGSFQRALRHAKAADCLAGRCAEKPTWPEKTTAMPPRQGAAGLPYPVRRLFRGGSFRRAAVKKSYEKPVLVKRAVLSAVTAGKDSLVFACV
jgi:hypothetical protein